MNRTKLKRNATKKGLQNVKTKLDISETESEEITSGSEFEPTNESDDSILSDLSLNSLDVPNQQDELDLPSSDDSIEVNQRKRKTCTSTPEHKHDDSKSILDQSDSEGRPPKRKKLNRKLSTSDLEVSDINESNSERSPPKTKKLNRKLSTSDLEVSDIDESNSERSPPKTKKSNRKLSTSELEHSDTNQSDSHGALPKRRKLNKKSLTPESQLSDDNQTDSGGAKKTENLNNQSSLPKPLMKDSNPKSKKKTKASAQNVQEGLENSSINSSLDISINLKSVGSVLKHKRDEVLATSQEGTKKNVCLYCFEKREKTKNPKIKIFFSKLADHYVSAHGDEKDVKELKAYNFKKVKSRQNLSWTQTSVNVFLTHFPNALDINTKPPSVKELTDFIANTKDSCLKQRKEPQIRSWIHKERAKLKGKSDVPIRNHIPNYIYLKFEKYIEAKKIPSAEACGKFLAKSPSKANITINNIQHWVELAIKRKST